MPIQAEGVPRKLADPFDIGGGHIDPDRAADPGLVYDIDPSDYTKFFTCTLRPRDDCQSFMGKLYQLNLPSISIPDLKNSVTVSRTVTNVGPAEATYRVTVEAPAGVDIVRCKATQTQSVQKKSSSATLQRDKKGKVQGPKLDDGSGGFPPFRFGKGGGGGGGGGGGSNYFGGFLLFGFVLLLDYLKEFEKYMLTRKHRVGHDAENELLQE
ncbi:hypothetical protein PR202_gb06840 [Eleusine coracana subsp. coracana]|uniref:Subtilisin-like protease fibronectin type-III domain-containing protein n=1 Tax=Eleusine coracana subsp. coracana TaxID=191504 RepID=A0AAV5EAG7_ELECO|nr:hypothetical protein PR202_gb06840 [Eleusine coracana subsp. coracana]